VTRAESKRVRTSPLAEAAAPLDDGFGACQVPADRPASPLMALRRGSLARPLAMRLQQKPRTLDLTGATVAVKPQPRSAQPLQERNAAPSKPGGAQRVLASAKQTQRSQQAQPGPQRVRSRPNATADAEEECKVQ